jgi:hypothetical protein
MSETTTNQRVIRCSVDIPCGVYCPCQTDGIGTGGQTGGSTGGQAGGVESVDTAAGAVLVAVDNSDPANPKIGETAALTTAVGKAGTAIQPTATKTGLLCDDGSVDTTTATSAASALTSVAAIAAKSVTLANGTQSPLSAFSGHLASQSYVDASGAETANSTITLDGVWYANNSGDLPTPTAEMVGRNILDKPTAKCYVCTNTGTTDAPVYEWVESSFMRANEPVVLNTSNSYYMMITLQIYNYDGGNFNGSATMNYSETNGWFVTISAWHPSTIGQDTTGQYYIWYPETWPENTELIFAAPDGSVRYGQRFTGALTVRAGVVTLPALISSDTPLHILSKGGGVFMSATEGTELLGWTDADYGYNIRIEATNTMVLYGKSWADRTNAPYDVWCLYTKSST